jgi:nitroreductase
MQPWQFVVVTDGAVKRRIREAAEEEERAFYHERASDEWLAALAPLGTDEHKPFLEAAPYLLAIFAQSYGALPDGRKVKNDYLLLVVGYPAAGAVVPVAGGRKKPLSEIATFM